MEPPRKGGILGVDNGPQRAVVHVPSKPQTREQTAAHGNWQTFGNDVGS